MKKKIVIGVVISLILMGTAFPFLKEYKLYKMAKNGNDVTLCDDYIDKYPSGRYLADILDIKDDIAYNKVKDEKDSYTCNWYQEVCPKGKHLEEVIYLNIGYSDNSLSEINRYLHDYPNGQYSDLVNAVCDSLWDAEILKYNTKGKKKGSSAAVKFMNEMLQYMKTHRINAVQVDVKSHLKLKDYDEYDIKVREFLESTNTNPMLSLESGMISLKSNFTEADISTLMDILSEGVRNSFDEMFTPGFIHVETSPRDDLPKLNIDYTIKSQEERYGNVVIPHIWTYEMMSVVQNYLIGISIFFNARFSIPGSKTTFVYNEKGEPADNISNIDNIRDGYRKMTTMCFKQFSNKMSRNLGMKETYLQDNEE